MDMKIRLYYTQYNFHFMMKHIAKKKKGNKVLVVLAELFFSVLRNGSTLQWMES